MIGFGLFFSTLFLSKCSRTFYYTNGALLDEIIGNYIEFIGYINLEGMQKQRSEEIENQEKYYLLYIYNVFIWCNIHSFVSL